MLLLQAGAQSLSVAGAHRKGSHCDWAYVGSGPAGYKVSEGLTLGRGAIRDILNPLHPRVPLACPLPGNLPIVLVVARITDQRAGRDDHEGDDEVCEDEASFHALLSRTRSLSSAFCFQIASLKAGCLAGESQPTRESFAFHPISDTSPKPAGARDQT